MQLRAGLAPIDQVGADQIPPDRPQAEAIDADTLQVDASLIGRVRGGAAGEEPPSARLRLRVAEAR